MPDRSPIVTCRCSSALNASVQGGKKDEKAVANNKRIRDCGVLTKAACCCRHRVRKQFCMLGWKLVFEVRSRSF